VTYRATGSLARSSCSLVCKCSYIPAGATPSSQGWNTQLFNEIGLGSIVQNDFKQLGGDPVHGGGLVLTAGLPIGTGLNEQAAQDLGLLAGTPVGSAVIDA
jgi:ribulose kinase